MAKGKRQAGTDLNHDNWNDDDEEEDAGEFKKASNEVLQQRVRKIAKRRVIGGEEGSKLGSNPFSGFGGFGANSLISSTPAPASNSPFSFLAKLPTAATATSGLSKTNGESKTNDKKSDDENNAAYLSKVKALNIAFVKWIKQHVDEDPLCDLRPVFKDYEKYLKESEELKNKPAVQQSEQKKDPPAAIDSFTFGKPLATNKPASPVKPSIPATESKQFSFGLTPASNNTTNTQPGATPFSFGLQKTSTTISAAPLFGNLTSSSATPFSFGNVTQNKTSETAKSNDDATGGGGEEEESDEPPKNEFKPVVEEDSLYSKRCKVFVKTGADYSDRGVGTVFLKKVEDKLQMIVRADTNLGNILLNIIISEGLPVSRMGKNNVMIVCVPTPESKPPPVPVLVRVKTGEEADDLLATIEKHKKE